MEAKEQKQLAIAQRVNELIERLCISRRNFAQTAGIDYSNLITILNGKRKVGGGIVSKILIAYPNVNADWLKHGEGEMFAKPTTSVNNATNTLVSIGDGNTNTYNGVPSPSPITIQAPAEEAEILPIIPRHIYEDTEVDVLEYVTENVVPTSPRIQQLPPYSMCYQVYSDELVPLIIPGDRLYIKEHADVRKIIDGKPYVLETSTNGLMLRTLFKGDTGLRAATKSQNYRDEYIPYEDIVRVYRILGMLRANM